MNFDKKLSDADLTTYKQLCEINERLEHNIAELRESGKRILKSEMNRTEECIRLRDVNADLITVLKSIKRLDDLKMSIQNEASLQLQCAMQDEYDEALPAAMRDVAAVLTVAGAA